LAARAALPPGFDPSAYRIIPARPTRLLNEGDEVDLGGRTLRALHTPGHTPGHVAFFDRANGILFTADVAYCGPMFLCFEECDPAAFARSVRRLAALQGVKLLCPGHEAIISNSGWLAELAERVDAALAGQLRGEAHDGFLRGRHVRFDGYSIWLPL
ncbi:MAG: MBL fold metallo-hydrolase, partial [Anaerolineales bacterium]